MALLKEDGSLDIEWINSLPDEETDGVDAVEFLKQQREKYGLNK